MYLRVTRRKNSDGSVVEYYQLAHNVWNAETRQSKAQILCSLGRADQVQREDLVRLCESIARVCGVQVVDLAGAPSRDRPAAEEGLPADVDFVQARELGVVRVVEALWERLGIGPKLRQIEKRDGCRIPYERALLAMVANRLSEPMSKLGVWDRWLEQVHLPGCAELKLAQMYEALDLLHAHQAEVEEAVFFQTATLLNLDVEVVLFDTTSCSFAIDEADEDGLRAYGYSKEGTWTPQVVVALAVTREGFPVRSWVFPGNTTDVSVVQQVRQDLRGWKLSRVLFVGDAGMSSEDNRMELARACGRYVLACRAASIKEIRETVLGRPGRYKVVADNLQVKEVIVGHGELRRRYIVCYNPEQAERERKHREQVVVDLEEALAEHEDHNARRKWVAQLRASGRYGRYLTVDSKGNVRIDRAAITDAARYDGKWVLLTNDDTLSAEEVAGTYKGLLVIERCFQALKSTQIEMRPMYHWLPRRIEAHVKVCVLALLIERVAEHACQRPWSRIRLPLAALQVAEFRTPTHRFFQAGRPENEAVELLKLLEVEPPKRILAVESIG